MDRRRGAAALALAALFLSACSSSGGKPSPSTSAAPGRPADAATTKAIKAAYAAFFNSHSTTARSQAALQHGAALHQALVQQSTSSFANDAGATVTSIRSISPNVAAVTFTITQHGKPLLAGVDGHAVRENGHWKVAAETFCHLLKLAASAPRACSDPAILALTD